MTKIQNDPQYIDFLYEKICENWGNKLYQNMLDELIAFYKEKEEHQIFSRLALIKQENLVLHGELVEATAYSNELIEVLSNLQQIEALLRCYNWSAMAHIYKGSWLEAIKQVNDALLIAEQGCYQDLHINLLLKSAMLNILLRETEKAEQILNSMSHMTFLMNDVHKMQLALNHTFILSEKNLLEEANKKCQEAFLHAEKIKDATGNSFEMCMCLVLRGIIFMKRQLAIQGERDFNEAKALSEEKGYRIPHTCVLICLGISRSLEKKYKEAVGYFEEALRGADEMASDYFKAMVHRMFSMTYEQMRDYQKAYESLKCADQYCYGAYRDKVKWQMDQIDAKHVTRQLEHYKAMYSQMEQVAKVGTSFTSKLTTEHIEKVIYDEIRKLLHFDFLGLAYVYEGRIIYTVYDTQGDEIDASNNVVRYTQRLAECSVEFQKDIWINDGNFEEYSMKVIKDSTSNARLQSMIVKPLKVEENVLGAVTIGSYQANKYTASDLNLVDIISAYMAITLQNAFLYQEVRYLADHDALTGILRRGIALKNGEKLFKENHKRGKSTAIIMFDADNFKQLNDKYGHQLGDRVLSQIGHIMKQTIHEDGYVGRYGGEEFIAILDGVTYREVTKMAETIKTKVESCLFETKKEKDIKVTLSGGIYVCNEYTLNFADAIRFADHALYRAKLLGRNRIISYNFSKG